MKYKNVSDRRLSVGNVFGPLTVEPGEEFLTAPKFAREYLKEGLLDEIKHPAPKKSPAHKEASK